MTDSGVAVLRYGILSRFLVVILNSIVVFGGAGCSIFNPEPPRPLAPSLASSSIVVCSGGQNAFNWADIRTAVEKALQARGARLVALPPGVSGCNDVVRAVQGSGGTKNVDYAADVAAEVTTRVDRQQQGGAETYVDVRLVGTKSSAVIAIGSGVCYIGADNWCLQTAVHHAVSNLP